MNSLQEEVYQAVKDRGYLDTEEWSRDQLIVRQVVKLIEEVGELSRKTDTGHADRWALLYAVALGEYAKAMFDNGPFNNPSYDTGILKHELADVQIVVYVLATLLGIDIDEEAHIKATLDVPRGVSC
jgi:NTP pyrophosphatase (non-canonical NTP hydrolase)